MVIGSYVYTGDPITPKFTLNIGERVLYNGTDFDVDITDNTNVGTAHVVITGKGKFKGVIERTFEITPVHARSLAFFADVTEFIYTGEPCFMNIAVKFGNTTLSEGVDYDIEYFNNINPGTANACLYFRGNFTGTMTIPFNIIAPLYNNEEKPVSYDTEHSENTSPDGIGVTNGYNNTTGKELPLTAVGEDALINTSRVSRKSIETGKKIRIFASAQGGNAPYSFAVFYKKLSSKNWTKVSGFTKKTEFFVLPQRPTKYQILVKAMDSAGAVAKKLFNVSVEAPVDDAGMIFAETEE